MKTTTNQTGGRLALVPDHELLRRLLDGGHLRDLLEIADRARAFRGDPDCVEGECDHADAPDGQGCALLVPVYATAEHLERLHKLRALLEQVHAYAVEGARRSAAAGMRDTLTDIAELTEGGGE